MSRPLSEPKRSARNGASVSSTTVNRPRYSLVYLPGTVSVTSANAARGAGTPAARKIEVDRPDLGRAELDFRFVGRGRRCESEREDRDYRDASSEHGKLRG